MALSALETCGHLDASLAEALRDGWRFLRRLEQRVRVSHGTSVNLLEEGAPGLVTLARRMGMRDGPRSRADHTLLERYVAVTTDVRTAYLRVLGPEGRRRLGGAMKLCPRCAEPYADDAGFCPFDGTALSRDPDPFVGRTLAARYRLIRRLGSGGMAVVYLARHVMIERLSAIKILRQDLGMNVSHRERFLREARAVNRINHPNIVEITDFGEDGGSYFW